MKFLSIASLFAAVGLVAAHGYHEGYNPYAKRGLYARDAEAEEDYFADLWERDVESDDLFARDAEPYYYDAELHAREAAEEAEWMDKNLLRRGAIISKVKNFGSKCKAEGGSPAPASKPPKLPHLFQCPMCGCVYLKPSTFIPKCQNTLEHKNTVTTQQLSPLDAEQIYQIVPSRSPSPERAGSASPRRGSH